MLIIDPLAKISNHFTWNEAAYLPSWGRMATEADGLTVQVLDSLKDTFTRLDKVRDFLGVPIVVLCAFRPVAYNALVGGAARSPHLEGKAVDFHCDELTADQIRQKILDAKKLEEWDLRMEDPSALVHRGWVHLDTRKPEFEHPRFFKP